MTQPKQPFLPLAGLTVLELPGRVELAVCASLLGSLGATVHVVEGTPRHPARYRTGKTPVHPREADDLALRADVILASPDVCLFPVDAREDAVRCDITAYGSNGPLSGRPDSEALVQARAGIADTTGRPDGAPCLPARLSSVWKRRSTPPRPSLLRCATGMRQARANASTWRFTMWR